MVAMSVPVIMRKNERLVCVLSLWFQNTQIDK